DNPEVIEHLKKENDYTEEVLSSHKELEKKLFQEMKGRIKEDDESAPFKWGDYFYYTRQEAGKEYTIYCRKRGSLEAQEEILLDVNTIGKKHEYVKVGVFEMSPNHRILAYSLDTSGDEHYTIYFKDLESGEDLTDVIRDASTSFEWVSDEIVYYTKLNELHRPDCAFQHVLGGNVDSDALIYQEKDEEFFLGLSKSRSERFIFLELHGAITSEISFFETQEVSPTLQTVKKRSQGVEYSIYHWGDYFYILTNENALNFKVMKVPIKNLHEGDWEEFLRESREVYLRGLDVFKEYLIVFERQKGIPRVRVIEFGNGKEHYVQFPDSSYAVGPDINPTYESCVYRISYSSLLTPPTTYAYHVEQRKLESLKRKVIPTFSSDHYVSEHIFVTSHDGIKVPVSLLYRKGTKRDGTAPCYLYGYGSYGITLSDWFESDIFSLIDRGFIYAVAHIRGGSELGRQWYEDGKFLKKKNTFYDFIATAEHLIKEKYTAKGNIAIAGRSAGGLLIGATLNMRPELFKAAIAGVPFVDMVNTMLDDTLPLTTLEYDEWGNPNKKNYFEYMLSYSPYDNIQPKGYPNILALSGLNDPRVTYWEPSKWVAKLREQNTSGNLVLLDTNMESGHGGFSGRFKSLQEKAREFCFVLSVFNQTQSS
ncbi:MAG: S9 family peptidase, partial [Alphaproteobacteria bacterium]|nr:S9 family peptidase [Alphaproteobacteria bacterium]